MSWQQVFLWSKKLHRLAMWFCIVLGAPLVLTGMIMENEVLETWAMGMDWGYKVRWLHAEVSMKFVLAFVVMVFTGLFMWAVPKILTAQAGKRGGNNE